MWPYSSSGNSSPPVLAVLWCFAINGRACSCTCVFILQALVCFEPWPLAFTPVLITLQPEQPQAAATVPLQRAASVGFPVLAPLETSWMRRRSWSWPLWTRLTVWELSRTLAGSFWPPLCSAAQGRMCETGRQRKGFSKETAPIWWFTYSQWRHQRQQC